MNHEETGKHPERISKIKPFMNKCNWKGIHTSSGKDDWEKFKKNNSTIAPNELYVKNEYVSCVHSKTTQITKSRSFF